MSKLTQLQQEEQKLRTESEKLARQLQLLEEQKNAISLPEQIFPALREEVMKDLKRQVDNVLSTNAKLETFFNEHREVLSEYFVLEKNGITLHSRLEQVPLPEHRSDHYYLPSKYFALNKDQSKYVMEYGWSDSFKASKVVSQVSINLRPEIFNKYRKYLGTGISRQWYNLSIGDIETHRGKMFVQNSTFTNNWRKYKPKTFIKKVEEYFESKKATALREKKRRNLKSAIEDYIRNVYSNYAVEFDTGYRKYGHRHTLVVIYTYKVAVSPLYWISGEYFPDRTYDIDDLKGKVGTPKLHVATSVMKHPENVHIILDLMKNVTLQCDSNS